MILARMEEPAPAHSTPLSAAADPASPALPPVISRMTSAAPGRVTPAGPWSVWTWIISLSANAGMDTRESFAEQMLMTASQAPAGMEVNVKTLWEIMNAAAHKVGSENNAKLTKKDVMNPLVKTTLCAWTFSRISSALVHRELMVNAVRLHPRDASETHA
jgi:hypothetical protein